MRLNIMKKKIVLIIFIIGIIKVEAQTSAFKSIDELINRGRYNKALISLKNMPETFLSNRKIASIYEVIDNVKLAIMYYEKALIIKDDYTTRVKLGKLYKKTKYFPKAITVFKDIVNKDPDNLLISYQLGKLYLLIKKPKKAITIFKKLIERDSANANYYYYKGLAYKLLKKRNLKINSFLEAYKKDKAHIKAIEFLAHSYTALRYRDSAKIFIDKGLEINPSHIKLNKLKINSLYRRKKYAEAIQILKKIDTLKRNELYTQNMLGRSFYNLKKYQKAEEYFTKAKQIDHLDYRIYGYLGDVSFDQKKYKEASLRYMYATFIGKELRDVEYYKLARTYEELNNPKLAIKAYGNALKENYRNYKALYQLATVSESYYKNKKIAYKHYKGYMNRFEMKDSVLSDHVKRRLIEIKKFYFKKGEVLD
ncbi:tetratricopeptide repeat protein [Tenacibaculum sp. nBUS_03]|uniref:tetratricopeptide repeat protein n=1 Tax=Tenacibaculum sp. nBUS_03 TaxID=3395320 RepID=UPI003EBAA07C